MTHKPDLISRRRFLQRLAGSGVSSVCLALLPAVSGVIGCTRFNLGSRTLLGGGRFKVSSNSPVRYVLSVVDFRSSTRKSSVQLIDTAFFPHGIHPQHQNLNRLALFQKKGPNACEVDLKSGSVVRSIPARNGRWFYGHGTYTQDDQLLFSTETEMTGMNGVIGVREADSLKYLGEFPTYGKEPHECKLIEGGKVLAVTNAGGHLGDTSSEALPNVALVDVATQKLLERIPLTNPRLNTGHLAFSPRGDMVVVSAPRTGLSAGHQGGVSLFPVGGEMRSMSQPESVVSAMRGEALSTVVHPETSVTAVTHPEAGFISLWALSDQTLAGQVSLDRPRGVIAAENGGFLVSAGQLPSLYWVSETGDQVTKVLENSYMTGSHLFHLEDAHREMNYGFTGLDLIHHWM
jgi:hypothetical protein